MILTGVLIWVVIVEAIVIVILLCGLWVTDRLYREAKVKAIANAKAAEQLRRYQRGQTVGALLTGRLAEEKTVPGRLRW